MGSQVASSEVAGALDALAAALGRVRAVGLVPVDARDAAVLVREMEGLSRQLDALRIGVLEEVDRRGLHRVDGHHSAKVFVRHHANLADREAARRARAVRALRDLPEVAASFSAGRIGMDQVGVLAAAHANQRVRGALARQDAVAARMAATLPFERFAATIWDWERLADQDGTADRSERGHRNRKLTLRKDPDGSWRLIGACGGTRGAQHRSILDAFIRAEFDVDWTKARADHGDAATVGDLARTDAQRAADAMDEIFQAAADAYAAKIGGSRIITNIVIDHRSFERELQRLAGRRTPTGDLPLDPDGTTAGQEPEPLPWEEPATDTDQPAPEPDTDEATGSTSTGPDDPGPPAGAGTDADPHRIGPTDPAHPPGDLRTPDPPVTTLGFRSSSLAGDPVDPSDVVAQALLGHVRRVVIGADSVVIDLGRSQRCFTGLAALAVKLADSHCAWPGCHVPTTQCQGDHLTSWATGGRTDPGNGAPLCGHHNRTKELGYRITRDDHGRLHTYRPDGTEIT